MTELTPLQSRLCEALRQVGASAPDPRIGMLVGGMTKHLTRQPVPDEDIASALEWVKSLVDSVLQHEPTEVPALPELTTPLDLSDTGV